MEKRTTNQVESDDPDWKTLDFEGVRTTNPTLTVTVFDDDWWRKEELGYCDFHFKAGSRTDTCYFSDSTVTLSYTLTCDGEYTP